MLIAPAIAMLSTAQPALANCTGGGAGGVFAPTSGSTVTCDANAPNPFIGSEIINFAGDVTVTLQDGAILNTTASDGILAAIVLNNATVTLGAGAQIIDTANGDSGVRGIGNATVTLSGDYSSITAATQGVQGGNGSTVTLSGDNSSITAGGDGVRGNINLTVTVGTNTQIIGDNDNNSATADGINLRSGTIISHGLIQTGSGASAGTSGDHSIESTTFGNNISLTLHTGSNLNSPNGADLTRGTVTLTLVGNNTEDEVFLGVETVEVNADATGWELTSTSTFDDVNINTGLFRNNGNLTINNALTVDSGASFGGAGTTIGTVTNNGTIAPGNSIGTQVINGNFVQGAGGTLTIEYGAGTAIDLLDISGTAALDGALTFTEDAAGVSFDTPLTFLDADGGITGTFSSVPVFLSTSSGLVKADVAIGANAATVTAQAYKTPRRAAQKAKLRRA